MENAAIVCKSELHTFSFKNMHLKILSANWWQFCLSLIVSMAHATPVTASGTTLGSAVILVKSLKLLWRTGIRFHLLYFRCVALIKKTDYDVITFPWLWYVLLVHINQKWMWIAGENSLQWNRTDKNIKVCWPGYIWWDFYLCTLSVVK